MCGSDMKKHIRFFRSSYNNSKLNVVKTYPIEKLGTVTILFGTRIAV